MRRLVFGLVVLAACDTATAQPPFPSLPTPRINTVFPMGTKAGPPPEVERFGVVLKLDTEVTITGFDLDEPTGLLFSHPGIKGTYIAPPVDPKKKDPPPKVNQNTPHKFKVTVDSKVPPGTYDLRVVGKWGVSNPRAFVIGDLNDLNEKEANNDVQEAQRIEIGTTVNGIINPPTDVDYTVFAGKKGQRVIVSCLASSIGSKAGPMIEVFDSNMRRLVFNRNYRGSDAVADLTLPADGDYYVRVTQFTHTAGGPDYFYRVSISSAPWIDAVFPPVIEPGKAAQVTLYGRNLPGGQPADGLTVDGRPLEKLAVTITPPNDPTANTNLTSLVRIDPVSALQDGFSYNLKGPGGLSNSVLIYFARDKLTVKTKPNNSPQTAEAITAPSEVAGFLTKRNEKDWYSFEAKKGVPVTIELGAERIGSEGDFSFSIRDGKDPKRDLAGVQDDDNDLLHPFGFYTRSSDPSSYRFVPPEDGKYFIVVGCGESNLSGPKSSYRLRFGQPKPDFRAIVMPYSRFFPTGSSAWQGGKQAYHVWIHRIDGYTGTLAVTVEGLPAGVKAQPLSIGPAARWGILLLDIAPDAKPATTPFTVKVTGTTADDKKLVRSARPASVTWGTQVPDQGIPVVVKLDQSLVIAVRPEKALFSIKADIPNTTLKPAGGKEVKVNGPLIVLKQGDKATVPVKVDWTVPEKPNVALIPEPLLLQQQNSPIAVQVAGQPTKDKPEVIVTLDARTSAVPGSYTIVLRGNTQVQFARDPMSKQKQNLPAEAFSSPIPVLVIPNSLGKITAGPLPNNTLKLGTTTELTVKVERQYDFAGEFTVKFIPAKGATGVTAEDVTIPAGKNEVKLALVTEEEAKPGTIAGTIVVTGTYLGKYKITHEAKVSFNVAKGDKK
ncbi:MAG: PPC domain-containing protein [Planctomycetia bacterium]|nr:PPC domain-containing protein [Planctomycetia bacterium]